MGMIEMQNERDIEYARSLGYGVEMKVDDESMEFESTHLFDYEKKTKEYLESMKIVENIC